MPFAELHLHLEGTLEPETIFRMAERNCIDLPYADVDELAAQYDFTDLQSFLNLYYANMATLRTAADFAEMTDSYLARAAAAGVRHAEVFLDPQAHVSRGIALEEVMDGVSTALASSLATHGISSGLIIAMLRDHSTESAMEVLEAVVALGTPIVGIGLDSAEVGHPPSKFVDVFARARAEGLHLVAHAGEEGPPSYIWEALDLLGVERIDHGIRCLEDDALVERLVAERMPLTVCPLSNVRLRVVDAIGEHPLPAMLRRGLNVSVNSDDPAYFGGYLDDNLVAVRDALRPRRVGAGDAGPQFGHRLLRRRFPQGRAARRDRLNRQHFVPAAGNVRSTRYLVAASSTQETPSKTTVCCVPPYVSSPPCNSLARSTPA